MGMKDKIAFQAKMDLLNAKFPELVRRDADILEYPDAFVCQITQDDNSGDYVVYYGMIYPFPECVDETRLWPRQKYLHNDVSFYSHIVAVMDDYRR